MGNVWHNLGVAYGKLFLLERAAECFAKAYELNQSEESFEAWQTTSEAAGKLPGGKAGQQAETIAQAESITTQAECESSGQSAEEPEGGWDEYLEELKRAYRESVR